MIKNKVEFANSLERFVLAQYGCYKQVLAELRQGQKRSHWVWFIFPQLVGLGHSEYAQYYGLHGMAEARDYLEHSILGKRYEECLQLLDESQGSALEILGNVDAKKLQSSLTLFLEVEPESPLMNSLLTRFYGGERDQKTIKLLHNSSI